MNKKIIIILAAVIMAAVFTACTNSNEKSGESPSATDSSGFALQEESSSLADITNTQKDAPSSDAQRITDKNKSNKAADDDNEVQFDAGKNNNAAQNDTSSKTTSKAQSSSQKSTIAHQESSTKKTEPATDKDGWINKWY